MTILAFVLFSILVVHNARQPQIPAGAAGFMCAGWNGNYRQTS